jgi:hypothetical protein
MIWEHANNGLNYESFRKYTRRVIAVQQAGESSSGPTKNGADYLALVGRLAFDAIL